MGEAGSKIAARSADGLTGSAQIEWNSRQQ